jgi:hypothetical protein
MAIWLAQVSLQLRHSPELASAFPMLNFSSKAFITWFSIMIAMNHTPV